MRCDSLFFPYDKNQDQDFIFCNYTNANNKIFVFLLHKAISILISLVFSLNPMKSLYRMQLLSNYQNRSMDIGFHCLYHKSYLFHLSDVYIQRNAPSSISFMLVHIPVGIKIGNLSSAKEKSLSLEIKWNFFGSMIMEKNLRINISTVFFCSHA